MLRLHIIVNMYINLETFKNINMDPVTTIGDFIRNCAQCYDDLNIVQIMVTDNANNILSPHAKYNKNEKYCVYVEYEKPPLPIMNSPSLHYGSSLVFDDDNTTTTSDDEIPISTELYDYFLPDNLI